MFWACGLADADRTVVVWGLSLPDSGDGGNGIPRHAPAVEDVVQSHVACDEPEERNERLGVATGAGPGQLHDGVGHAA